MDSDPPPDFSSARYVINRKAHSVTQFRDDVTGPATERERKVIVQRTKEYFASCGIRKVVEVILGFFPILHWLPRYKPKKWLGGDVVAGFTVGIVHIPQSLAFAALAGVPSYYGLYVTFYTVLIYALMGTSRHLSVGTFAIPSVLTQAVVIRFVPESLKATPTSAALLNATMASTTMTTASTMSDVGQLTETEFYAKRVAIASALCMLMGIFQLVFGMIRLGMITTYMSEPLLQGFTTGAALYVVLSQMPAILGISPQPRSGIGSFYLSWGYIFTSLPKTHVPTLIISIICIIVLAVGREVNERCSSRLKVPIPTEVILVVVFIIASYFGKFKQIWAVKIVDTLPLGFVPPQIPDVSILGSVVGEAFGLAIVGFALNISVSKFYAQKFGYTIDSNQELVAYGMTNLIPSFFQCFPNAAALARCQIQVNSGGKTQVVSIIVVIILLLTILVAGPLFEPLPRAVLGCIIAMGLVGVLKQFTLIWPTFKASIADGFIWIFTFLAICSLGVDIGLFASMGFAMVVTVLRTQRPSYQVLGSVKGTDIYRDHRLYKSVSTTEGILVFKFNAMLYYVNKDYFKAKLFKASGFDPDRVINQRKTYKKKIERLSKAGDLKINTGRADKSDRKISNNVEAGLVDPDLAIGNLKAIIVDFSAISMLDIVGVKTIKALQKSFNAVGVEWILANVSDDVRASLARLDYYEKLDDNTDFISVHDAVLYMEQRLKTKAEVRHDLEERTSSL